ncbi:hypothetical protein OEZ85_002046 [Tetradesmus obliquus]|uniref:Uncharacterized protein n=1 Tax=Tetradesmus obliquus TaxID=3088 RepID=A0ABY8U1Q8_TETOB|nr:hypothetical protein OEZ85_002046 [Tetradesmus obliquus]
MTAIMQVHNVPRAAAEALLMAGACFTWQQLQDAAARLVPGLQVWAVISRKLDLQMDASVPQIAAAICCGDDLDVESPLQWDLPSDAAADALSSRSSTAVECQ